MSWGRATWAWGSGLALLTVASAASAVSIGVTAKKLIVIDKREKAGKAKVVFVAKDANVTKGAGLDPNLIGVQFGVKYGNGSAAGAFTVAAGVMNGWVVNKDTVAKYVNKAAPTGPTQAKVAVIKPMKLLKLVGKGLGDAPLDILGAGDPGAGGVQTAYCVTNGGEENCHCSAFTGCVYRSIAAGTGAKLVCKEGTPDDACPAACFGVDEADLPSLIEGSNDYCIVPTTISVPLIGDVKICYQSTCNALAGCEVQSTVDMVMIDLLSETATAEVGVSAFSLDVDVPLVGSCTINVDAGVLSIMATFTTSPAGTGVVAIDGIDTVVASVQSGLGVSDTCGGLSGVVIGPVEGSILSAVQDVFRATLDAQFAGLEVCLE